MEPEKGQFLRWLHRDGGSRWGTDPGAYDPCAVAETVRSFGNLFGDGRYFPLEVTGWEHVPPAPAMFVCNHSGGTTIPDVWGLGVAWYRHFGVERPLHPMAHEMVLSTALTGPYFSRRGVLRGGRAIANRVLVEYRRDLLVLPGGDLDTWRPYSKRWDVVFGGRIGYARIAIATGVPIVPIAHAGAHETLVVLTTGRRIARALRLPQIARAEIFPIHLSLPWGLTVGPFPHLPIPTRLRYRIGAPIAPPDASPDDDEAVRTLDARVRAAVQSQLDELRATRHKR